MDYTEIVMDHALNPRNVGSIEQHDGYGTSGDVKVRGFRRHHPRHDRYLADVRFLVGCGAAIATCSMTTELVKGETVEEAARMTDKLVSTLGRLPRPGAAAQPGGHGSAAGHRRLPPATRSRPARLAGSLRPLRIRAYCAAGCSTPLSI